MVMTSSTHAFVDKLDIRRHVNKRQRVQILPWHHKVLDVFVTGLRDGVVIM